MMTVKILRLDQLENANEFIDNFAKTKQFYPYSDVTLSAKRQSKSLLLASRSSQATLHLSVTTQKILNGQLGR